MAAEDELDLYCTDAKQGEDRIALRKSWIGEEHGFNYVQLFIGLRSSGEEEWDVHFHFDDEIWWELFFPYFLLIGR